MRGDNKSRIKVNKSNISNITHVYNSSHVIGSSQNMRKDNTRKYTIYAIC